MERWTFVLLCLSFVGGLVFGSIFPPVSPPGTSTPTVPSQREVTWSPEGLVTVQGMVVGEEKIYTRVVHAEGDRNSAAASPEDAVGPDRKKPADETAAELQKDAVVVVVVVDPDQKKPADESAAVTTGNNSDTETPLHQPSG